ncbi:MAG: hypothetical protein AAF844_21815, partial [Pseudomonadota bacterium]
KSCPRNQHLLRRKQGVARATSRNHRRLRGDVSVAVVLVLRRTTVLRIVLLHRLKFGEPVLDALSLRRCGDRQDACQVPMKSKRPGFLTLRG